MKRLTWLIAAAAPLVTSACSSAPDQPDNTGPSLTSVGHGGADLTGAGGSDTGIGGSGGEGGSGGSQTEGSGGNGGELPDGGADGADGANFDCDVLGEPGHCGLVDDCDMLADHAPWPGYCPGASDIQCCIPSGLLLCDPAKKVLPNIGKTTEAPGLGGCPAGMIRVSTFCVDKYEASLIRMGDGSSWSPYSNPGLTPVIAVSVAGAVPQGYIDGDEAGDACANAGKRLCTDDEWLRACQGPDETTYPYGDTKVLGVCKRSPRASPCL